MSSSLIFGSPGATLFNLPSSIQRSSWSTMVKQVVKRVDDKQQRLVVVNLKVLVNHPLQLDGVAVALRATRTACAISP